MLEEPTFCPPSLAEGRSSRSVDRLLVWQHFFFLCRHELCLGNCRDWCGMGFIHLQELGRCINLCSVRTLGEQISSHTIGFIPQSSQLKLNKFMGCIKNKHLHANSVLWWSPSLSSCHGSLTDETYKCIF